MPVGTQAQNRDVETAAYRDHALDSRGVAFGIGGHRLEANEAFRPDLERIEKNALQPGREQSMVGLGEAQVLVELCHVETGQRGAMVLRDLSKHAFGRGTHGERGKRLGSGRCAGVENGHCGLAGEIRVVVRNDPGSSPRSGPARRIENEACGTDRSGPLAEGREDDVQTVVAVVGMPPVCPFDFRSERLAEVRDSAGQDRDLEIQQGVGVRDRRAQQVMDRIHERGRIAGPRSTRHAGDRPVHTRFGVEWHPERRDPPGGPTP